jgi:hypothetical protein
MVLLSLCVVVECGGCGENVGGAPRVLGARARDCTVSGCLDARSLHNLSTRHLNILYPTFPLIAPASQRHR